MSKRILSGIVISWNANKTIVVKVTRRVKHKLYKKIISRSKNYHAHDEDNNFKVGDSVKIIESKQKDYPEIIYLWILIDH